MAVANVPSQWRECPRFDFQERLWGRENANLFPGVQVQNATLVKRGGLGQIHKKALPGLCRQHFTAQKTRIVG
jgi:hypothetical protein